MIAPDYLDFNLAGPLPSGLTVVEASAGTGKTWAIAALAVRYLADGVVDAEHLLAVTFTHLASADLRARLYDRLLQVINLVSQRDAASVGPPDALVDIICDGPPDIVDARLQRLRVAARDFDAATIATIHEFCRRATDWLGPLIGGPSAKVDDEAASLLADQTVADLTLANLIASPSPSPAVAHEVPGVSPNALSAATCAALGRAALAHADLPIVPGDDAAGRFATACRNEYARRKSAAGIDDFADTALRLDRALRDAPGQAVAEALSARFHVVLVDEFQDTDPVQWSILRQAFAGRRPLILVGDPKQSIYAFRGADVHAYLQAVTEADTICTLPVNYRSDNAVVQAVNQVFAEADFGHAGSPIPMRTSTAAHTGQRLRRPPNGDPPARDGTAEPTPVGLELRCLPGTGATLKAAIDKDLVAWVAQTLADRPQLRRQSGAWQTIRASDIAVLVSSNKHGERLNHLLRQAGVPAVFSGVASVFASAGADEWLVLLDALAHPRPAVLRRAMVGQLIGLPLDALANPDADGQTVEWAVRLRSWASNNTDPSAIISQLEETADLSRRLVGQPDGERLLTDVHHVTELLARQARHLRTPAELLVWLRTQNRRAVEFGGGDRTRRLETDRPTVTVLTVHAAKGLEFPVVLVPATADTARHSWAPPEYPTVWREDGHRVIDTRTGGPGQAARAQAWAGEQAAEERRRLYVAMTRAACLTVAWLGGRNAAFRHLVAPLMSGDHPGIKVVNAPAACLVINPVNQARPQVLAANTFHRVIDQTWVRTSYSGLTAGLHDQMVAKPVDEATGGADDEPANQPDDSLPRTLAAAPAGLVSPMSDLPAGAAFGTIVHGVLEACPPGSSRLRDDLAASAARLRERSTLPDLDADQLAAALVDVLHTPLGPVGENCQLADLGSRRLAELTFEMPLGDADAGAGNTGAALAALFDDPQFSSPGDPLAGYGAKLAATSASDHLLRGFLTGSIDLVTALPSGRLLLIDYKTNRLGAPGEPDAVAGYSRPAMDQAMQDAHYPLQALLYAVVLRRYLAWRRPGVPFDDQWSGVAYLFVRGMAGPSTPLSGGLPCGVFGWRPSAAMIEAADVVLAGGRR